MRGGPDLFGFLSGLVHLAFGPFSGARRGLRRKRMAQGRKGRNTRSEEEIHK